MDYSYTFIDMSSMSGSKLTVHFIMAEIRGGLQHCPYLNIFSKKKKTIKQTNKSNSKRRQKNESKISFNDGK